MKRLTNQEKKNLGILINYYRNMHFRSDNDNKQNFKQVNFCKNICSQAQLSRLENGEPLIKQEIYEALLNKLNLHCEKIATKDIMIFETYLENILISQNNDKLLINYNEYVLIINDFQNIFKRNIIYTHYNYVLEFIINVLNNDLEEAEYLYEAIENTLEILPPKFLVLALQYLGKLNDLKRDFNNATKFYLLSIEHMHKHKINNPIIYLDISYNYIKKHQYIYALDFLNKAFYIFNKSNNNVKLANIKEYYGLIYLYNRYYDEGINYLLEALQIAENKTSYRKKIINLLTAGYYLKNEYQEALNYVNKTLDTSEGKLLSFIINKSEEIITFDNKHYNEVAKFYLSSTNKEFHYEKYIKPIINELPDEIKLVIINDIYINYKSGKKYKKILELVEDFII